MQYCGLDLGKKSSHFCVVDGRRRVIEEGKVRNRVDKLVDVFGEFPPMKIALEASTKVFWMADRLRELGHEPVVVDPGRTKAIGAAKIKHDKLDARVLAQLCAAGLLAEVDQPTEEQRLARMPMVVRGGLVRCRVGLINQVRGLLDSEGIELRKCSVEAFIDRIADVWDDLPVEMAQAIEPVINAIDELNKQITACDAELKKSVAKDPDAQLLMTAPGVGPIVAACFLMVVRDPSRFASGRAVGAYLGLVPALYQSGATNRRGRITKRGNPQARWLLTIAANVILGPNVRQQSAIRQWGLGLIERVGRKKAVIAVARKLASVLWAMLRKQTAFEPRLAEAA